MQYSTNNDKYWVMLDLGKSAISTNIKKTNN